jgi:hypothetical protein
MWAMDSAEKRGFIITLLADALELGAGDLSDLRTTANPMPPTIAQRLQIGSRG